MISLRRLLLIALAVLALAAPARALPRLCLPPVFEGGQRLHQLPAPNAFWLELLLRQHELCWYQPAQPGEQRIALLGNSAVYGLPLPVEETLSARLNERLGAAPVPAHVFNLAQVFPYQMRDAVVLRAMIPYRPDILLYPLTLQEFVHVAPILYPPLLVEFFRRNFDGLEALLADTPAGLSEPMARYARALQRQRPGHPFFDRLREVGSFARIAARHHARTLARRLAIVLPEETHETKGRETAYDCQSTLKLNAERFANWQDWNILAYVQQLRDETGMDVLIVSWPLAHEPVGDCYNVRYSNALVAELNEFLRQQSAARGLAYLDLHDLLPPEEFFDSLHPTAAGHRRIAERLAAALEPILRARAARGAE